MCPRYLATTVILAPLLTSREAHECLNLSWRSNSSEKHIVLGALKAEKAIYDNYINDPVMGKKMKQAEKGTHNVYTEVAAYLSLYGSVRLIDVISEEDIYNAVYEKMEKYIQTL